jgi:hypothetical protein
MQFSTYVQYTSSGAMIVLLFPGVNPILQTVWLNNHALTLKRNTAKYYLGENLVFAYLPKN